MPLPPKSGLYDPAQERDACGVGFVADIKGTASHKIVRSSSLTRTCLKNSGSRNGSPRVPCSRNAQSTSRTAPDRH